jgi:hypothetical protein
MAPLGNVDPANERIEGVTDFPAAGAYDSHDQAIVDRQAGTARPVGITGFIASWWGRDSFEDRGIPLRQTQARGLRLLGKNCGPGCSKPHHGRGPRHRLPADPLRQRQGLAARRRKAGTIRLRPRPARAFACRLAGGPRPGAARQPAGRRADCRFGGK